MLCVYMCMHSHEGYRRLMWVGKWHTIFLIQLLLFGVQKALHTLACSVHAQFRYTISLPRAERRVRVDKAWPCKNVSTLQGAG